AGSGQRGEEQSFATEQGGLETADELDVVVDARLEADDAAGVDAQDLAGCQRALLEHAAGVDERPSVALQALEDEALAAEQTGAEALRERDADAHTLGRDQERVLLREQLAAQLRKVHRHDATGIGRRERGLALALALVLEHGHEQRLADQQALAGAEQCAHEATTTLRLLRAVA